MARVLCLFAICVGTLAANAAEPASVQVERYLHEGRFAEGEVAMLLALDTNPSDDEARFALGALQVVRAVENLGKALYEYGLVSESASQPFLRLPVPKNEKPTTISYQELGRVLDAFAADLARAEATLAEIRDDDVKLKLRLNNVTFDFIGTGEGRKTLLELLTSLNGNRIDPKSNNLDFRFHFDRGDVAWLRAYCHFLCAIVEGYRAVDVDDEFERRMNGIFPKVEASNIHDAGDSRKSLKLADAPRLRRMRLHLVKVCELNRETWTHIRKETDDDFEWLPHPKQTDQLGMPMTDQRIDAWLGMMEQLEGVLNGDRLIPGNILTAVYPDHPVEKGLNLKKLLDDPRPDLFDWNRIKTEGIDAKYLEPEKGKQLFDISAIFAVLRMFGGPLGFAHAARLN